MLKCFAFQCLKTASGQATAVTGLVAAGKLTPYVNRITRSVASPAQTAQSMAGVTILEVGTAGVYLFYYDCDGSAYDWEAELVCSDTSVDVKQMAQFWVRYADQANVERWRDTAVATPTTAGVPTVDFVDAPNSIGVAAIKTLLGTIPASGNWLTELPSTIPAGWIGTGVGQISVANGVVAASGNWATVNADNTAIGQAKSAADSAATAAGQAKTAAEAAQAAASAAATEAQVNAARDHVESHGDANWGGSGMAPNIRSENTSIRME